MINIIHTPIECKIEGNLPPYVHQAISDTLSYSVPNAQYTDAYLAGNWDGRKRIYNKRKHTFPSGLLWLVEEVLAGYDIPYQTDKAFPDIQGWYDKENDDFLRDYQFEAVLQAVSAGRGVVHAATGSGKTWMGIGLTTIINRPTVVIAHRKELVDQFQEHMEGRGMRVGLIRGGQSLKKLHKEGWESKDVYVAMARTLDMASSPTLEKNVKTGKFLFTEAEREAYREILREHMWKAQAGDFEDVEDTPDKAKILDNREVVTKELLHIVNRWDGEEVDRDFTVANHLHGIGEEMAIVEDIDYQGWLYNLVNQFKAFAALPEQEAKVEYDNPTYPVFQSFTDHIEVIIIDEVQRSGAEGYFGMVGQFRNAHYRYGLSATIEGRSDGADILLHAATGPVVARCSEQDMMEKGHIAIPQIYMVKVDAEHRSSNHFWTVYQEGVVYNEERNKAAADAVIQFIRDEKYFLVLCQYIPHGRVFVEYLNERIRECPDLHWVRPVEFIHGQSPRAAREGEINSLRRGESQGIILSSIGDEGLDIPRVDALVVLSGMKSKIKALQRVGRALRVTEGSSHAVVVDFMDLDYTRHNRPGMLSKHSMARGKAYESRDFPVEVISPLAFRQKLRDGSIYEQTSSTDSQA